MVIKPVQRSSNKIQVLKYSRIGSKKGANKSNIKPTIESFPEIQLFNCNNKTSNQLLRILARSSFSSAKRCAELIRTSTRGTYRGMQVNELLKLQLLFPSPTYTLPVRTKILQLTYKPQTLYIPGMKEEPLILGFSQVIHINRNKLEILYVLINFQIGLVVYTGSF